MWGGTVTLVLPRCLAAAPSSSPPHTHLEDAVEARGGEGRDARLRAPRSRLPPQQRPCVLPPPVLVVLVPEAAHDRRLLEQPLARVRLRAQRVQSEGGLRRMGGEARAYQYRLLSP